MNEKIISIRRPDDMHIHLRDGAYLQTTVPHVARQFARAIIMPNLNPPIISVEMALAYRERILSHAPQSLQFEPLMTLYLTDDMDQQEIKKAKLSGHIFACKLYPAGSTTNSASGVTSLKHIYPLLAVMQDIQLPLLIHGEVVDPEIDVFDREKKFIDESLVNLLKDFPELPIVLEHITTKHAIEFVLASRGKIGATITAHHLLINRNDMLVGGIRPHYFCLPICKRKEDQIALIAAATSGNKKFFLGTDSAPHPQSAKESACGCAGIYSAHAAIELYAEVFEAAGASTEQFEAFCSNNGADFYGLERNQQTITLRKQAWQCPAFYEYGDTHLIPFRANSAITWTLT